MFFFFSLLFLSSDVCVCEYCVLCSFIFYNIQMLSAPFWSLCRRFAFMVFVVVVVAVFLCVLYVALRVYFV